MITLSRPQLLPDWSAVRAECAVLLAALLFAWPASAVREIPPLSGPVVDEAGFLSLSDREALSQALRELAASTGTQFSVLTLKDLGGEPIEAFSIRVVDKWRLGTEKGDRGLLILLSRAERRIRIEVGQGLEGQITDAQSRRVIDEVMAPLMREGKPGSAIALAIVRLSQMAEPSFPMAERLGQRGINRLESRKPRPSREAHPLLLFAFFVFWFLVAKSGRGRRRRDLGWADALLAASILGSGRGGGGGGGWSGGGGGFSGGGASGGW